MYRSLSDSFTGYLGDRARLFIQNVPCVLQAAKRALLSTMLAAQHGLDISLNRGSPEHCVT